MIKILNIKKTYGINESSLEVLRNINLEMKQGETVALLGKSGSGKSTLLSLIAGLDKADQGEIRIDNKNILSFKDKELTSFRAKNIGIVFQQFHLVSTLTAIENVMLSLDIAGVSNSFERASDFLKSVNLFHRKDHLPHELSGGECQRVAIARALVTKPKLLLADEPSGNLDEETGEHVMNLFFELVRENETTLILVTHDNDLAKRCQRIVHLERGEIV